MFDSKLMLLRKIFQKNVYPENFIDKCFDFFLNRIHIFKEKVYTINKKPQLLVLLCLGTISLQTRFKLPKFFNELIYCCIL